MNNFYIASAVYLNLIFVAAKLWGRIEWPLYVVMAPMIVMTIVGVIASVGQAAEKKKLRTGLVKNLQSLKDLIDSSKRGRADR